MSDAPDVYSVYSLTDGVAYDDYSTGSDADAWDVFSDLAARLRTEREAADTFPETTVHLYDAHLGVMVGETCILRK